MRAPGELAEVWMTRTTAVLVMLCALGQPACATEPSTSNAPKGRVQLTGSIVDSACTLSMSSDSQTVTFKPTALNGLIHGNNASQQSLKLYIGDCLASTAQRNSDPSKRFKLTFEGDGEGQYFSMQGSAHGVALQIKDKEGKSVSPGMLLEHNFASSDLLMLSYSLTLVGTGHALEAGDYHATIKLSIQHF